MDDYKLSALMSHGAIKPEHIANYLNKTDGFIDSDKFMDIDKHVGFDTEHLDRIIRNGDNSGVTYIRAAEHPNADHEIHNFALQKRNPLVGQAAARNAYHPSTFDIAVKHYDPQVRIEAATNRNISADHLKKLKDDPEERISHYARIALADKGIQ